ncbi:MAG: hypothetical protein JJE52_15430 [Acidimicrobiia bacterium]|nr:hypothetical protein [Acidimicrobiia bacterium]
MVDEILPVADWPTLLVGPIVRRVTRTEAHIFIATSVMAEARVLLYPGRVAQSIMSPVAQGPMVALDRIGTNLWVGLLPVTIPAVAPDVLYSYDLEVRYERGDTQHTHGLDELGLLGGTHATSGREAGRRRAEAPLGYAAGMLPSFLLPPRELAALRLAQGSCRKPHGGAEKEADALQIIDGVVERALLDPGPRGGERPHQLILTGDQIYADDVAAGLLRSLTAAGDALLGWDEQLPGTEGDPLAPYLLKPGWRSRYLSRRGIGLKSAPVAGKVDYSASHLLRFGEWCAMYLFAWSDALWVYDEAKATYVLPPSPSDVDMDRIAQVVGLAQYFRDIAPPDWVKRYADHAATLSAFEKNVNTAWDADNLKVQGFADTVCLTRRVLANVATYTMFDDHEVTDDWYLNRRVHDEWRGSEAGRRILRNGLSAYAIFQQWGNVPDDFAVVATGHPQRKGRELLKMWMVDAAGSTARLRSAPGDADAILDIAPSRATVPAKPANGTPWRHAFGRIRWDYSITFPTHRLLVLDTRTWREFPAGTSISPAALAATTSPGPGPATAGGTAHVRALAATWQGQTGPARSIGDLMLATVVVAESVGGSDATVRTAVTDVVVAARRLLDALPRRAAVAASVRMDPSRTRLPLTTNRVEVTAALAVAGDEVGIVAAASDALRDTARHDMGAGGVAVSRFVDSLAEMVDAASVSSPSAVARAGKRVVERSGADLWAAVSGVGGPTPLPSQLAAARTQARAGLDAVVAGLVADTLSAALFRDGSSRLGVGLISTAALAFQIGEPLATAFTGPTVVVSPAPVFGNPLVEGLQLASSLAAIAKGRAGEEELDYEAWSVNIESMHRFVEALAPLGCTVILSGDVHYAGSAVASLPGGERFIQLTSSPARNSEPRNRSLGLVDDLVYGDGVTVSMQADWMTRLRRGAAPAAHLANVTGAAVTEKLRQLRDSPWPWERMAAWVDGLPPDFLSQLADRAGDAVANTGRSMAVEVGWKFSSSVDRILEFRDDPARAVFGDFLTAGPPLREQTQRLFREMGVDPTVGLTFTTEVLLDRRTQRLRDYPALHARAEAGSVTEAAYEKIHRRTVGHSNVGLIRFVMRSDEIVGVEHELLWYPYAVPLEPVERPRPDWIGTRHLAGWYPYAADLGLVAP